MLLGALFTMTPAEADPLPAPTGRVLLTVTGAVTNTNGEDAASFDLTMLRDLGAEDIVTETIWTTGPHTFTGVRLSTLLTHVGAQGETLAATAINDYSVEIPVSDATDKGPIVAYEMDGKVMSRRDKGPLWVIYPYSSAPEYRTEVIYSRSIWQLDRLIVEE
jgi:hypothetical protein